MSEKENTLDIEKLLKAISYIFSQRTGTQITATLVPKEKIG